MTSTWVSDMAHRVRVQAMKSDNLSLNPGTHMVQEENWLL